MVDPETASTVLYGSHPKLQILTKTKDPSKTELFRAKFVVIDDLGAQGTDETRPFMDMSKPAISGMGCSRISGTHRRTRGRVNSVVEA